MTGVTTVANLKVFHFEVGREVGRVQVVLLATFNQRSQPYQPIYLSRIVNARVVAGSGYGRWLRALPNRFVFGW